MTNDSENRSPEDKRVINPDEPWEITYWTKVFGCTRDELKEAVHQVGNSVPAVKAYFEKQN
jgi:hypothetical protein